MSVLSRLLKGAFLRNVQFVISVLVTLIMVPIIVGSLGERMYGYFALLSTFIGYYGLLDLGLSTAVSRFVARSLGAQEPEEIPAIVGTAFWMFVGLAGVGILLSLAAAALVPRFVTDPEEVGLMRSAVLMMGCALSATFPLRAINGVLVANLRWDVMAGVTVTRTLAANACIYLLLMQGRGLLALIVVNSVATVLEPLAQSLFCRLLYRVDIRPGLFSRRTARTLLGFGGKSFIINIAEVLRFRLSSFVVAGFVSVQMVTYYSIGAQFMNYFVTFMYTTFGILTPVFSHYDGEGDAEKLKGTFLRVSKVSLAVAVFTAASFVFYGEAFILRWLGEGFEASYHVLLILVGAYVLFLSQVPCTGLLFGTSRHHYFAVANICEGVLTVLLSLALVRPYGIYGVAAGTALSMAFFKLLIQPAYICHAFGIPWRRIYVDIFFTQGLVCLAPLIVYHWLTRPLLEADYLRLVLLVAGQAAVFLPVFCFVTLGAEDRRALRRLVWSRAYA